MQQRPSGAKMSCAGSPVLSIPVATMTTTSSDQQRSRRPRFWVGPLVAGACFALGYGITQRVLLMQQVWDKPQQATFRQNSFPGETLDGLRRRYGADQPLMGDVATKEALDAAQRDANQQAEALAKEAKRREQGQQAVVAEPVKVNQESELTAEPVASPNPDLVDEVVPEVAQPAAVVSPNPAPALPEPEAVLPSASEPESPVDATPEPEPVVSQPRPAIDESLIWQTPPVTPPAP